MKITLSILFSLVCFCSQAQNVLVKFYPDNQPFMGLTNYPLATTWTDVSGPVAGWSMNMALSDYNALVANLTPIYNAGASNALEAARVSVDADLAALVSRLATNNVDRLRMTTNTLNNADLNVVVFNLLRTMHKIENLLKDQYAKNPGDAGQ